MEGFRRIEAFIPDAGAIWSQYQEQLVQLFVVNETTDEDKKKATLLAVCGRECYHLLSNLAHPDKPSEKSYDELCRLLQDYVEPNSLKLSSVYVLQRSTKARRVRDGIHGTVSACSKVLQLRRDM